MIESKSRRWSISARLAGLLAAFAVAGAALAGWAWTQIDTMRSESRQSTERHMPQLLRMAAMELTLTRVSLQARHAILARTPSELEATMVDIGGHAKRLETLMAEFEAAISTATGRERFVEVRQRKAEFWKQAGAVVEHVKAGRREEAFAHLADHVVPARDAWLGAMGKQREWQEQILHGGINTVADRFVVAKVALASMLGLLVLGAPLCAWFGARAIRLRSTQAAEVAAAIAAGDLTVSVDRRPGDEFAPLFDALAAMRERLVALVAEVQEGAQRVAGASQTIAADSADLNGRTQAQAASLQQTAASMEEIGVTVRHNADTARQATQLAGAAREVASRGGALMADVVATMQEISHGSQRVADIVGTIDSIAFQTNILALNAAVEAARAGDQGRGFAVVASEVRALAKRSAAAAREIKALIGSSVERVEAGAAQVDAAGATVHDIVTQVQRVADLIGEIDTATSQQSRGIEQVTLAVADLDGVTQHNTALVDRSASAAEGLREQSQRLVQVAGAFRLAAT